MAAPGRGVGVDAIFAVVGREGGLGRCARCWVVAAVVMAMLTEGHFVVLGIAVHIDCSAGIPIPVVVDGIDATATAGIPILFLLARIIPVLGARSILAVAVTALIVILVVIHASRVGRDIVQRTNHTRLKYAVHYIGVLNGHFVEDVHQVARDFNRGMFGIVVSTN